MDSISFHTRSLGSHAEQASHVLSGRDTQHQNGGEVPAFIKQLPAVQPPPSLKEASSPQSVNSDAIWRPGLQSSSPYLPITAESPEPIEQLTPSVYQSQPPSVRANTTNQTLRNSQPFSGLPVPEVANLVGLRVKDYEMITPQTLDQNTALWEEYNRMADKEDGDFVKAATENLNTLLIFAALFAAINASFIVETFKTLKPDPVDRTNTLLETMLGLSNSSGSQVPSTTKEFITTIRDIRTNFVFFFSLCASLAGSFLAVMGKQWVSHYELEGSLKPPAERARERQMKFEGRKQYHLQGVMESLSTILQVSLIVFLGGLADFLWPLNKAVAGCVVGFTGLISLTWGLLTCIAALVPKFPYQTRLSLVLNRLLFPMHKHGVIPPAGQNLVVNIRAICQMLEHIVLNDTKRLDLLADALEAIPLSTDIKPLGDAIVKFCFEPLLITTLMPWNQHQTYVTQDEFQSLAMMRIIHALFLNSSALDSQVRTAILSHIWFVSWQSSMEPASASVIATLLGDEAKSVENNKWPSPNWAPIRPAPRRCNMPLTLATHLYGRLVENTPDADADAETTAARLKMFYSCLPPNFSSDPAFNILLRGLAEFLGALPPTDPKLKIVADIMTTFFFQPLGHYDQEGPENRSCATIGTFSTAGDSQANDPKPPINVALHYFPSSSSMGMDERYPRATSSYSQSLRPARIPSRNIPPQSMEVSVMSTRYRLSNTLPPPYPPMRYPSTTQLPPQNPSRQQYNGQTPMRNRSLSQPGYLPGMYGPVYGFPTPAPTPHHGNPTPLGAPLVPQRTTTQFSNPPPPPLPNRTTSNSTPDVGYVIPYPVELALPTSSNWKSQLIDEMLRSMPMLKILLLLISQPSLLSIDARRVILPRIWSISWDPSIDFERAEVICDILVLEATEVEKMQNRQTLPSTWTTPDNRAMALSLASRLSTRIVGKANDDDAKAACLSLFFQRLPAGYTKHEDFIKLLEGLAIYFESIPLTHPSINHLATAMMKYGFQGLLPALSTGKPLLKWPLPGAVLDLEEFKSLPILKLLRILFSSPSALKAGMRKDLATHLWARFWSDLARNEAVDRMSIVADILALAAAEVEAIRGDGGSAWEEMVKRDKYREGVVIFASHLCARIGKEGWLDTESLKSCQSLLHHYFSLQDPDTPELLKSLIQTMATATTEERQDRDEGYLTCLRFFFTDLIVAQKTDSSDYNYIAVLQDDLPRQLGYLLPTLNNNPNLSKSHGVFGLALLMALWEHLKPDESLAAQFDAPSFGNTVLSLITQEPVKEYWLETNTSNLKLTHHEGSYMLDRLSSFLIHGLRGFYGSQVSLEEVALLGTYYKKWYRWFQNSKAPLEFSLQAFESFSRLNDEMKQVPNSVMRPPEQPSKPKLPPSPSHDEGSEDSEAALLRLALSASSQSTPEVRRMGLGRPRHGRLVRFEESTSGDLGTPSRLQPVTSPLSQSQQYQFHPSVTAKTNTRQSSNSIEDGPEPINHAESSDMPVFLNTAILHFAGSHPALLDTPTSESEGVAVGPSEGLVPLEGSAPLAEPNTPHAVVNPRKSEQDSTSGSDVPGSSAVIPAYHSAASSPSVGVNQGVGVVDSILGGPSLPFADSPRSSHTLDVGSFQHEAEDSGQDSSAIRLSVPSTTIGDGDSHQEQHRYSIGDPSSWGTPRTTSDRLLSRET